MTVGSSARIASILAAAAAGTMLLPGASLAAITASDPFITITATSSSGTGTLSVPLSAADTVFDPDMDLWGWTATSNTPILSGSNVVATLVSFGVIVGRQTQPDGEIRYGIDFNFTVLAGSSNTSFEFLSPTLTFTPVTSNAIGLASAGFNGTDQNGNGISITPGYGSGFSYQALFNGSSTFQQYLNTTLNNGLANSSVGDAGNPVPAGVFQPIAGSVSSIQSRMKFTLSAGDSGAGSSQYSVAPAPGAMALLGLGGLVAGRRRRN